LELDHCSFPDHLLYDLENNTWVTSEENGETKIGVTSLLSAIAGRFASARIRPAGTRVERGRSLGTLESLKFVGPIPAPISGIVSTVNTDVVKRPKLLNDEPYDGGWVVKLKPLRFRAERAFLSTAVASTEVLRKRIAGFHARCFKAFPDYEMYEIGTECSAVLVHLNELLATVPVGDTVHLVTDDPTSYVEMVRWTDQTGHKLVDWRQEGNLFHFIVRKEH
jgi:glycine cleavage system H lipoate-binding protein/TusA-related sulfurtransferase